VWQCAVLLAAVFAVQDTALLGVGGGGYTCDNFLSIVIDNKKNRRIHY